MDAVSLRTQRIEVANGTGTLRLAVRDWGDPAADRTVVCIHGLTRNARDFDALAGRLARSARVLCVDLPGRGGSDWLADPMGYAVPTYATLLRLLLGRLNLPAVDWIGTSLGGLIGMVLAGVSDTPIRRLVLNDVGPFVPKAPLELIKGYLGLDQQFAGLAELEQHLRLIHAPFGPLTDAQWRTLAVNSSRRDPDGTWRLHYDPAIRAPFASWSVTDIDLWSFWDAIRCPTLILRGADSTLLEATTATAMMKRGPKKVDLVEWAGIGHAPALVDAVQIATVADWLDL
ncbi:MAG: alpha/beta hydrolase [Geminicoccaceae bacterium]